MLIPVAAVVLGLVGAVVPDGDARWFRESGLGMLGPGMWNVFVDPGLQIGPVYLVALGCAAAVVTWLGLPVLFTLAAMQGALVTWLGLATARRAARRAGVDVLPVQWAIGLALALGGLLAEAIGAGHPEEIILALLLAGAACRAERGRLASVGLLIGLAGSIKLWGVLGIPIVLLGRRPRDVVVRGMLAAVVVAACYAPFFAWGEVNTFSFAWNTMGRGSVLAQVGARFGASDWALRVVQGAVAIAAGCVVALRRKGSPLTVVVCVLAARLLLDPLLLTYYPGPLVVLVLLWVWTAPGITSWRWRLGALAAVPVLTVLPYLVSLDVERIVWTVLMLAVPAAILRSERVTVTEVRSPTAAVVVH